MSYFPGELHWELKFVDQYIFNIHDAVCFASEEFKAPPPSVTTHFEKLRTYKIFFFQSALVGPKSYSLDHPDLSSLDT